MNLENPMVLAGPDDESLWWLPKGPPEDNYPYDIWRCEAYYDPGDADDTDTDT